MRAVRQFTVVPAIPAGLAAVRTLAANLHWTWDRETQDLFARLDPSGWEESGHDPLRLLTTISPGRLMKALRRQRSPALCATGTTGTPARLARMAPPGL